MYVKRNIVPGSRDHCCKRSSRIRSLSFVELHVTFNHTKYGVLYKIDIMANLCHWQKYFSLHLSARYFCPILTKFDIYRQIFMKIPSMKCHGNSCSRSGPDRCGQTDGHDEANRRFSPLINKFLSAFYILSDR